MDWFNHLAPAIQAFAAVGVLILTGVLAWANWKYVRLVAEQLRLLQEHALRQRPLILFGPYASGSQLSVVVKSASESIAVLENVGVKLTRRDNGVTVLEHSMTPNYVLRPGKSWSRTLHDGLDGRGLAALPRRYFWHILLKKPGPEQPAGLLSAEVSFRCGGESFKSSSEYMVYTGPWGARIEKYTADA